MNNNQPSLDQIVCLNRLALADGVELLQLLSDAQYGQTFKPVFASTIGAHFRHVIEHYQCFNKQLSREKICYDERERDACLEVDRDLAIAKMHCLADSFCENQHGSKDKILAVRDQQYLGSVQSTVARELLFLHEHTVHHYAIIAAMTRMAGVTPKADFGVAVSTLQYQAEHCEKHSSLQPTGT